MRHFLWAFPLRVLPLGVSSLDVFPLGAFSLRAGALAIAALVLSGTQEIVARRGDGGCARVEHPLPPVASLPGFGVAA